MGYRYTTSDNTQYLNPYHMGNAALSKTLIVSKMNVKAFIQVNNIWDQAYQIIAYFAMPGRYYQAGIAVNFEHLNK